MEPTQAAAPPAAPTSPAAPPPESVPPAAPRRRACRPRRHRSRRRRARRPPADTTAARPERDLPHTGRQRASRDGAGRRPGAAGTPACHGAGRLSPRLRVRRAASGTTPAQAQRARRPAPRRRPPARQGTSPVLLGLLGWAPPRRRSPSSASWPGTRGRTTSRSSDGQPVASGPLAVSPPSSWRPARHGLRRPGPAPVRRDGAGARRQRRQGRARGRHDERHGSHAPAGDAAQSAWTERPRVTTR